MAANNTKLSPRQKMINLMYIVLTAMLALNVSSDVLDGFVQVHHSLERSNQNVARRNQAIYNQIQSLAEKNPEKALAWFERASQVSIETENLLNYVDSLTQIIVVRADGSKADPSNIRNRDDLEAAAVVMLSPRNPLGRQLRGRIDEYRADLLSQLSDSTKVPLINAALSTEPIKRDGESKAVLWEEARFDQQPVVAAVTHMTKLKSDILYAEGEVLASLLSQIDAGDVRVNELNAFVIPNSRLVMRGGQYEANIVLAAIDTTMRPEIYINNARIDENGRYRVGTSATGTFDYTGYINVPHPDGSTTRHPFSSSYTVIEPMATVSATMMNVLYAGIDNPISISVPGVSMKDISATMTNGTLTRKGDLWVARPTGVGKEAVLTVTANIDGRNTTVANSTFRIRRLPDPTAYLGFTDGSGNPGMYKGGKPFAKASLMAAPGLEAAIDDGLLDTKFNVTSFQTIFFDQMGNAMPENSDGAKFSSRQKQRFQNLQRGKRFYISNIKAVGPDGISRDLSPIEVIIG